MKCLSIMEPFGTLISKGEKIYETRSWKTKYRGSLWIHTSKRMDKECRDYCLDPSYIKTLGEGYIKTTPGKKVQLNFPCGCIISHCELVECLKITQCEKDYAILEDGTRISGNELIFGDYTPGRYAWKFTVIEALQTPIPAKGSLGIWNYKMDAAQ